jgi:AcrR family transcriptional regulator
MSTASLPREERRRRSETAILEAARELFAEDGFERTTIRGVAARAGVDPALVMQHFGSKERLFATAAHWPSESERLLEAETGELPAAALDDLFSRFEGEDREAAVALLRNCLTHPEATRLVRDEVMCERQASVSAHIEADDAQLRAALVGAVLMGVGMARYLIELEPVASASQEELRRLVEPLLRQLVEPD